MPAAHSRRLSLRTLDERIAEATALVVAMERHVGAMLALDADASPAFGALTVAYEALLRLRQRRDATASRLEAQPRDGGARSEQGQAALTPNQLELLRRVQRQVPLWAGGRIARIADETGLLNRMQLIRPDGSGFRLTELGVRTLHDLDA